MLQIGIIGTGSVAHYHARSILSHEGARISALIDTCLDSARRFEIAFQLAGTRVYSELESALRVRAADAYVICTPPVYHHTIAKRILCFGAPVFIEKPMAGSLVEADELIDLAEKQRVTLQVGHVTRYDRELQCLRDLVLNRELGELTQVRLQSTASLIPTGETWHSDRSISLGGILMDLGVHALDALLLVTGAQSVRVEWCRMRTRNGASCTSSGCEEIVTAGLVMDGTILVGFSCAYGVPAHAKSTPASIELYFTKGYARNRPLEIVGLNESSPHHTLSTENGSPHSSTDVNTMFATQMRDFIQCCTFGTVPRADGRSARSVVQLALAMYEASQSMRH